tara:strand:- start:4173 stop:4898 length:726 start_codon:yes stop_codon:yes gene_type:complete
MQDKKLIVDNNLESLKMHFKVDSDGELAEKLDTSYRAIAQWRWKNKIPKWVLRKYDQVISGVRSNAVGVQEQVVVENQPIHITKGEETVDASYIIDLQKDKIESQKKEIARLNVIVNQQKETKNKPAFHFKTKSNYESKKNTFSSSKVTGDTSMTGYTKEYLSNLKAEEWFAMYHPESANQLVASIPTGMPDHTHHIFKHILWKAKNGVYRVYNIESYFNKEEGVVRAYYYWVNGDIEGQS